MMKIKRSTVIGWTAGILMICFLATAWVGASLLDEYGVLEFKTDYVANEVACFANIDGQWIKLHDLYKCQE
jgi:hypothetical protein